VEEELALAAPEALVDVAVVVEEEGVGRRAIDRFRFLSSLLRFLSLSLPWVPILSRSFSLSLHLHFFFVAASSPSFFSLHQLSLVVLL